MKRTRQNIGFSLTEVLLAVATLSVGMLFVGGTFILGIHYSQISTEQTLSELAAQEANVMVRLHLDPNDLNVGSQRDFSLLDYNMPPDYPWYPSIVDADKDPQYHWSALCRRIDPIHPEVAVTVLVSRVAPAVAPELAETLFAIRSGKFIATSDGSDWLHHGAFVVDDATGRFARVWRTSEEDRAAGHQWELRPLWDKNATSADETERTMWMVRPPTGQGKSPCIYVEPML